MSLPVANALLESVLSELTGRVIGSAVLALIVALIASRCARPAVRHALWLLVFVKLTIPAVWSVPMPTWSPQDAASVVAQRRADDEVATKVAEQAWLAPPSVKPKAKALLPAPSALPSSAEDRADDWFVPCAAWVWGMGSLLLSARLVWGATRFGVRLRRDGVANEDVNLRVSQLARRLQLRRTPRVRVVDWPIAPLIWNVGWRATVVVPKALVQSLNHEALDTLLLHELAHLRRRDHWVRWLEVGASVMFWWSPVVWWARRELRAAEEQSCDAWVVWAQPSSAKTYAQAIVTTLDLVAQVAPLNATGLGRTEPMERRLTMIFERTRNGWTTQGLRLPLAGLALVALSVAPGWGQEAKSGKPDKSAEQAAMRLLPALEVKGDGVVNRLSSQLNEHGVLAVQLLTEGDHMKLTVSLEDRSAKEVLERLHRAAHGARCWLVASKQDASGGLTATLRVPQKKMRPALPHERFVSEVSWIGIESNELEPSSQVCAVGSDGLVRVRGLGAMLTAGLSVGQVAEFLREVAADGALTVQLYDSAPEGVSELAESGDEQTKIYRLRFAFANDLAKTLSVLMQETKLHVNVVADERTNSLIVLGPTPAQDKVYDLIQHLDRRVPQSSPDTKAPPEMRIQELEEELRVLSRRLEAIQKELSELRRGGEH